MSVANSDVSHQNKQLPFSRFINNSLPVYLNTDLPYKVIHKIYSAVTDLKKRSAH